MTIIAIRDGIIAADARATIESEAGGTRYAKCTKLFYKKDQSGKDAIICTAGEAGAGLLFVDWYGSGKDRPELLVHGEADIDILVVTHKGVYEYDRWCVGEKLKGPFFAIGSGAKAALGAMHAGVGAIKAAKIACKIDPFCAGPITTMTLMRRA